MPKQPTGPVFSTILVLHILCFVVSFVSIATSGIAAARARRRFYAEGTEGAEGAEWVRKYFSPGTNWGPRYIYGMPVFGTLLIVTSNGYYSFGDVFVIVGMAMWVIAVVGIEAVLLPVEKKLQREMASHWADSLPVLIGGSDTAQESLELDRTARRVSITALILDAVLIGTAVVMTAKP
ncbi:MAG: hypothetical protein M1399_03970 [Actinobacteria bacterium]|nr:hypothetical protein [Actinomycetota bacterium]MCL5447548.1 hypothetical protein [Actinomycetota bacterium]